MAIARALRLAVLALAAALPALAQHGPAEEKESGFFGVGITTVGRLVLINSVYPGTPAEKLARPGDLILTLDGQPVGSTERMIEHVKKKRPGEEVKLFVLRGDQELLLVARLARRPADAGTLSVELPRAQADLAEFLQTSPDTRAIARRGVAHLRSGDHEKARVHLAATIALLRADLQAGADGTGWTRFPPIVGGREAPRSSVAMQRELENAGWLLKLARSGAAIPENLGLPKGADLELARRVESLVARLADPAYRSREEAMRKLARLGPAARTALRAVRDSDNLEQRWRARHLLETMERALAESADEWQPAVWEVTGPGAGGALALKRLAGPALVAGADYAAAVLESGDQARGRRVALEATGEAEARQAGTPALPRGTRLVWLVRSGPGGPPARQ